VLRLAGHLETNGGTDCRPPRNRIMASCNVCHTMFLKKNIIAHMRRRHADDKCPEFLKCVLVDKKCGIFMCAKSAQGTQYPVHVLMKVTSTTQEILCEDKQCQDASRIAARTNFAAFQCPHIRSTACAQILPDNPPLHLSSLQQLVDEKIIKPSTVSSLTALNEKAVKAGSPAVCWWQPSDAQELVYLSVFSDNISYYSSLGRVIVRVNKSNGQLDCACCSRKSGCIHKKICLWFMAQFHPEIIAKKSESSVNAGGTVLGGTELLDIDTADNGPADTSNASYSYVPSGVADFSASDYVQHTRAHHSIPVALKLVRLSDNLVALEPHELLCPVCATALVRYAVTKCGKVFDVNRIVSGWLVPVCCPDVMQFIPADLQCTAGASTPLKPWSKCSIGKVGGKFFPIV